MFKICFLFICTHLILVRVSALDFYVGGPALSSAIKIVSACSQLNGANGEVTGTDDMNSVSQIDQLSVNRDNARRQRRDQHRSAINGVRADEDDFRRREPGVPRVNQQMRRNAVRERENRNPQPHNAIVNVSDFEELSVQDPQDMIEVVQPERQRGPARLEIAINFPPPPPEYGVPWGPFPVIPGLHPEDYPAVLNRVHVPYFIRHQTSQIPWKAICILTGGVTLAALSHGAALHVPILATQFNDVCTFIFGTTVGGVSVATGVSLLPGGYENNPGFEDQRVANNSVNYHQLTNRFQLVTLCIHLSRASAISMHWTNPDANLDYWWFEQNKFTHYCHVEINIPLYTWLYSQFSGGVHTTDQLRTMLSAAHGNVFSNFLPREVVDSTVEVLHQTLDRNASRRSYGAPLAPVSAARSNFS